MNSSVNRKWEIVTENITAVPKVVILGKPPDLAREGNFRIAAIRYPNAV